MNWFQKPTGKILWYYKIYERIRHTINFSREKETLFNRVCTSKAINDKFEKFRQLLLIKEFKKCLHDDVKHTFTKKKLEILSKAVVLADDYLLTHKNSGNHKLHLSSHLNSRAEPFHPNPNLGGQSQNTGNPTESSHFCPRPSQVLSKGLKCYYC